MFELRDPDGDRTPRRQGVGGWLASAGYRTSGSMPQARSPATVAAQACPIKSADPGV